MDCHQVYYYQEQTLGKLHGSRIIDTIQGPRSTFFQTNSATLLRRIADTRATPAAVTITPAAVTMIDLVRTIQSLVYRFNKT